MWTIQDFVVTASRLLFKGATSDEFAHRLWPSAPRNSYL